jgi:hypothetical protein
MACNHSLYLHGLRAIGGARIPRYGSRATGRYSPECPCSSCYAYQGRARAEFEWGCCACGAEQPTGASRKPLRSERDIRVSIGHERDRGTARRCGHASTARARPREILVQNQLPTPKNSGRGPTRQDRRSLPTQLTDAGSARVRCDAVHLTRRERRGYSAQRIKKGARPR